MVTLRTVPRAVIAIFSDTHSDRGHELEGAALDAARSADAAIHAGDFTSEAALEAFRTECRRLYAVRGNADDAAVRERLPGERTVDHDGLRIAVAHRVDGGATGLAMFGRAREADVVVFGHTHRPAVIRADDVVLVNPGSHAQPRGHRPGFATLEVGGDGRTGVSGEVCEPDGTTIERIGADR